MSKVLEIIAAIDTIGGEFQSGQICDAMGIGPGRIKANVVSMLCYLCKRGVIRKLRQDDKFWVYATLEGTTAMAAHTAWKEASNQASAAPPQRRGPRPKREEKVLRPNPAFPLGAWRSKQHTPVDPPRFVRGGS